MTAVHDGHIDTMGVHGPKVDRITAQDLLDKGKLERANAWIESNLAGENVESVLLPMDGRTRFAFDEGWHVNLDSKGDSVPLQAWCVVKDEQGNEAALQLSKGAVLELTSAVGLPKTYVTKTPARLVVPHLDYWYESPDRGTRLLMMNDVVQGATKATFTSVSNEQLASRALGRIRQKYGIDSHDVLVDKTKSRTSLASTSMLFVIPEATRAMRPDDDWSGGVQVRNSLTGQHATDARSYLFRWWCTNGATTSGKASSTYSRRPGAGGDGDAYDWIGRAVDQALNHLEGEFDKVEAMTTEPIEGEVRVAIDNLAARYKLSNPVREAIRNQMLETPDVTMYGLMQAVTAAANQRGIAASVRERLMDIGGDFVYGAGRCESCHSILVEDHEH